VSRNPEKIDVVTPKIRKKMLSLIVGIVMSFPKTNVAEDLVTFTERKRVLVSGSSARPGKYRYANAPIWREVAYEMSESSKTTEGVVMAATQTGKSENMLNHELYCVEYGIGPVCYVSSDEGLSLKHSETRFKPMLKAANMLKYIQAAVESKSNKSDGDKIGLKFYKGTFIQFIGARSESKASSTPIRVLHIDEIDKFKLQLAGGGNPVIKLLRRTDSYENLKKILYVSTPKRKATSQIEPLFKQGDMRYYHVECQNPECGELHRLEWSRIKWDKDEKGNVLLEYDDENNLINDPVWHECPHCGYHMKCHEKVKAMAEEGYGGHAKWIPTKKPDRPGLKSWTASGLYGFRNWISIALEFQAAKDDVILLEDFICDTLAETWSAKIDKPDEHYLQSRVETDWERTQIPDDVKILSIGADVHPDRIEWHLLGFGRGKQAWSCNYDSEHGDIYEPNDPAWDRMEDILRDNYYRIDGSSIPLHIALFDASGKAAEVVKNFCERFPYTEGSINGVYPCLGKATLTGVVKEHESTIATPEILLNDQKLKFEIYNNLKKKKPAVGERYPNGYVHFHGDYHADFFKQLVSEEVEEISNTKGTHTEFFITNKAQRRNETLDTFKMSLGGLYYMYTQYFKMLNKRQKSRKKKEIPPSWDVFWNLFEDKE
jgi:phage terminase large subunit GpA-like protein